MKRVHLVIIFIFLFVMLIMNKYIFDVRYSVALEEKLTIDEAIMLACDDAADSLTKYSSYDDSCLVDIETTFFRSLAASLSVFDELESYEELKIFVPMILVNVNDGFYMNYLYETPDGIDRMWTELIPYSFQDDTYIYRFNLDDTIVVVNKITNEIFSGTVDKVASEIEIPFEDINSDAYKLRKLSAISTSVEAMAKVIMNNYNFLSGQFGMLMNYSIPTFFDGYSDAMNYSSVAAVFQGYPLSIENVYYNNHETSASYLTLVPYYKVTIPDASNINSGQYFSYYHKITCPNISNYGTIKEKSYRKDDALNMFGAYPCPDCIGD